MTKSAQYFHLLLFFYSFQQVPSNLFGTLLSHQTPSLKMPLMEQKLAHLQSLMVHLAVTLFLSLMRENPSELWVQNLSLFTTNLWTTKLQIQLLLLFYQRTVKAFELRNHSLSILVVSIQVQFFEFFCCFISNLTVIF